MIKRAEKPKKKKRKTASLSHRAILRNNKQLKIKEKL